MVIGDARCGRFPIGIAGLLVLAGLACGQIRVTQSGGLEVEKQDGSSWENALSAATLAARLGQYNRGGTAGEYWLAAGAYPQLRPQRGVKLYGGFDGTETQVHQRDPQENTTIIRGVSFSHYQVLNEANEFVEWQHPGEGVVVDGCTLLPDDGGILALSGNYVAGLELVGSPLIQNCRIVGSAGLAPVVNVGHGPLTLVDCEIRSGLGAGLRVGGLNGHLELVDCMIHSHGEAGVVAWNGGSLHATRCVIRDNSLDAGNRSPAVSGYSGVNVSDAAAVLVDCTISGNRGEAGGGVSIVYGDEKLLKVEITGCVIRANTMVAGWAGAGGLYVWAPNAMQPERVVVTRCRIEDNINQSTSGAGGVYLYGSPVRIDQCRITGNQSLGLGGGLFAYAHAGEPSLLVATMRNTLVAQNTALNGGGVYLQSSDMRVINCTIADNTATNQGGGLFSQAIRSPANTPPDLQSAAHFANTAFIGNSAAEGSHLYHVLSGSYNPGNEPIPPKFSHCAVPPEATWVRRRNGVPEPLPIPAGLVPITPSAFVGTGDYHPAAGSPLIDAGSLAFSTSADLDLQPRFAGSSIDVGAYEAASTDPNLPPDPVVEQQPDGRLRVRFTGRLQFSPNLKVNSWVDVPGAGEIVVEPTVGGFWRGMAP